MRIGIIGVGRIGAMHARNFALLSEVDQLLLFDSADGRAAEVAGGLGERARDAGTLDTLISQCDGVLIATPTTLHPEMVRRCLEARVPVFCEKPIALDLEEMTRLVADIDASGVEVLVGFQRRFDPPTVELHRRIRAGEVGKIYLVRALGPDAEIPHLSYIPTSGGIHRDLLIHDLDAVPWLVGEPVVEVYASGSVLVHDAFQEADDVDNTVVMLRFASGAHALLCGARHNPLGYDCRIEVFGSKDSLAVGLNPRTPLTSLEQDGPRVQPDAYPGFPERFRDAYLNELSVFLDVLAGRAANPSPARESIVSFRLAEACEVSRRSGKPVRLDQPVPG
jgi:myo-inositol 2-dehydrogenase/D-chiro-inositol 1-dehydrogenase